MAAVRMTKPGFEAATTRRGEAKRGEERHGMARRAARHDAAQLNAYLALSGSHGESLNDELSLYDSLPLYREEAVSSS